MARWSRWAGTVVVAGILLYPVSVVLAQPHPAQQPRRKHRRKKAPPKKAPAPAAPVISDGPMANDKTGSPARPVDVLTVSGPEGSRLVPLWRIGPADYSGAQSVDLLFATYGTTPEVVQAEFRVGTCTFKLASPIPLKDNSALTLVRDKPCVDKSSTSAQFWIVAKGEGRIAWWTWEMPATADARYRGLTLTSPAAKTTPRSMVRGQLFSKPR